MRPGERPNEHANALLPAPTDVGVDLQRSEVSLASRSPVRTILVGIGGRGTLMLVNLLVLLVTSRLLTPSDFGIFAVAQLSVDLAAAASHAFVGVPLLQRKRMRAADYGNAFALLLILGSSAGALLAAGAKTLEQGFGMPGLSPLLHAAACIVPVRCMLSFFIAVLQRRMKVERIIWAQTKSQVISALGVTLVCAALGFGAWSLLLGLAAGTLLELAWLVRAARIRPHFALGPASLQLAADGVAPLASRMLMFASDAIDRLAVGAAFGAAPLGIYTRASNLVLIPTNLIGQPAHTALLSWFSRLKSQPSRVSDALAAAIAFQGIFLVPVTVAFCLASPLLVQVVLGDQWLAAVPLAQMLFVGAFSRLGIGPIASAALSLGYAWGSARRQFASTAMLVLAGMVALQHSLFWVAVAVASSRVFHYLLELRFAVVTFAIPWRPIVTSHASGVLVALVALAVALAGNSLAFTPSASVAHVGALTLYVVVSSLLIAWAPDWLLGPAAPVTAAVIKTTRLHFFARNP